MDDRLRRLLARMIAGASLELSPRDPFAGERLRELLAPGLMVFVNHPADVTHHEIVAACKGLRRAGFVPVPHVAARHLASFTQASDFLRRAQGEAAVKSVLVTAGDRERPAGPFHDSLDLVASGVVERHGVGHVLFAGHPEGHPRIGSALLDGVLARKLVLARERGLDATLVTQFGFASAPLRRWFAGLAARGLFCPVRIGVAGPASLAALAVFAVRCGAGVALPALARRHAAVARVLTEAVPDALIAALFAEPPAGAPIAGLHIVPVGGVGRAAAWIAAWRDAM
jgi:methylenetetrahydrofolate reductase (NADPH)